MKNKLWILFSIAILMFACVIPANTTEETPSNEVNFSNVVQETPTPLIVEPTLTPFQPVQVEAIPDGIIDEPVILYENKDPWQILCDGRLYIVRLHKSDLNSVTVEHGFQSVTSYNTFYPPTSFEESCGEQVTVLQKEGVWFLSIETFEVLLTEQPFSSESWVSSDGWTAKMLYLGNNNTEITVSVGYPGYLQEYTINLIETKFKVIDNHKIVFFEKMDANGSSHYWMQIWK